MNRAAVILLLTAVVYLQYKAWFSDVGYFALQQAEARLLVQKNRSSVLESRNRLLRAQVLALQDGYGAVEASARTDLGMVRSHEEFYLVADISGPVVP